MDTETVVNEALSLRKQIRSIHYATPLNSELNVRLVDISAIQGSIKCLREMGESTREFDTYIPSLLLVQCDDLNRVLRHTKDAGKISRIYQLLGEAKEYLWPTRN